MSSFGIYRSFFHARVSNEQDGHIQALNIECPQYREEPASFMCDLPWVVGAEVGHCWVRLPAGGSALNLSAVPACAANKAHPSSQRMASMFWELHLSFAQVKSSDETNCFLSRFGNLVVAVALLSLSIESAAVQCGSEGIFCPNMLEETMARYRPISTLQLSLCSSHPLT